MSECAKSRKTTWREALTVTLSVLAFVMSATVTYITVIRQTDDLSLVISSTPATTIRNNRIELNSNFTVSFINAGNRGAIIHHVWILVDQVTEGSKATNCLKRQEAGIDTEPAIIKEKDVVPKRIKAVGLDGVVRDRIGVAITPENLKRGFFPYEVCLGFFISTPSQVMIEKTISLFKTDRFDIAKGFTGVEEPEKNERIVLIKRSSNIISEMFSN